MGYLIAYELRAKIDAGLVLSGYENGDYEWIGTNEQWDEANALERQYAEMGYD